MPQEPSLTEQTKKIFVETVDIYRRDLSAILKNPLPLVMLAAVLLLFWLAIAWA